MAITIKDIAKMAGVSISTVSRVLNNSKPVNEEIRKRVMEAVEQTGYRPNAMARGLVRNQSGLIGIIIPEFKNTVFDGVIDGVSSIAKVYGYDILLSMTGGSLANEIHYLHLFREKQVDGIVLSSVGLKDEHIEIIQHSEIPCVLVGQVSHVPSIPSVHVDNFSASYEAVTSLIQHGHRRIAMIRGPVEDIAAGHERSRGYRAAMADAGICVDESWIVASGFSVHDGYESMRKLIERGANPTAVFAAADRMAIGAMNYLFENGYHIPDDLSIVGFDDIDMSSVVRPKLTTVHYSANEIGMTAVRNLMKKIKGEGTYAQHTELPHRLVMRDSIRRWEESTN